MGGGRVPGPLRVLGRTAVFLFGSLFALSVASSVTIRSLQAFSEAKRKKFALPCKACKGTGFYECKLCKGNSTIEWSPLYDPIFINPYTEYFGVRPPIFEYNTVSIASAKATHEVDLSIMVARLNYRHEFLNVTLVTEPVRQYRGEFIPVIEVVSPHPLRLSLKCHRKRSSGTAPELSLNWTLMVRLRQSGVAPADMARRMQSCFCVTILPRVAPGSWFCPSRSSSSVLHLAKKPLKICEFPLVQTKIVDFFKIKRSWGFEKIES
ncbi:Histone-lysine N-methyltransferase ATXR6 [Carex littledalei]|uniref:Histone-lysine N-methyltransferase ATXR6 n=1 Tax=Carex littledalei TaxID=544730 RepID=A0A833RHH8_9POAL|nr:Histone-lysine N-methyltransferase ATXR6 [Carex littledalei]